MSTDLPAALFPSPGLASPEDTELNVSVVQDVAPPLKPARPVVAPVRVLHVINGEHYAGAERVQDLLAGGLPKLGFEVEFACVKPSHFPDARCSHAPLHELPMLSRLDMRGVLKLSRLVAEGEHDVIHCHTPRSALVGSMASRLTGVPFVYHVHSPTARDSTSCWRNRVNDLSERFSLRRATAMIAVSQSLGRQLRRQGHEDSKVFVVPNGVPTPQTMRSSTPPAGDWTIGTVALFRPRKGLEVLLEAIAQLAAEGMRVYLRAVGTFETNGYREEIMHHVARLGIIDQVDWVGFTTDVPAELARMDMLALPSLFGEGLPMVVLEAMAAGVPVVASCVEGVPEAIENGCNGLLVPPGNVNVLARSLRRVANNVTTWQMLRENAMQTHAARFSDRSLAEGVAEVYRHVLETRRRAV